jgi:hypothetical protein
MTKYMKQKRKDKISFLEKKNEEIANNLFILQEKISEEIKSFYNKTVINDYSSDWWFRDHSIYMNFCWLDKELTLYSEKGKPVFDGCSKRLAKFLRRKDSILEFMLLDQEYYTMNEMA